MNFHVVTLFPEMIESALRFGVVGQAVDSGIVRVTTLSPRAFTTNVHQTVDDRPFGGGDGMVMIPDPLASAIDSLAGPLREQGRRTRVIHLSPRGRVLDDRKVRELTELYDDIVLVSSRYAGIDQRLLNSRVDEEISIGDYVLSGGELAALVMIDAMGRLHPGVLGNEQSPEAESFAGPLGLLEQPQFTRPREWQGAGVPLSLLSGDHARIAKYNQALSLLVTLEKRPEIVERVRDRLGRKSFEAALTIAQEASDEEWRACGLGERQALMSALEGHLEVFPRSEGRSKRRNDKAGENS